jgi:NADH dehydrogenase FAD-containing subunit
MKVVIVGGGMAGLTAASSLRKFDKHVDITVVDPKEYMEVHWASVRSIFDSKIATKSTFDINKWAVSKKVKVVKSSVTKLTATDATLSDGTVIEFNAAIICTGAQTKFPALGRGPPSQNARAGSGTKERRLAQLEGESKKYLNAKSVLVVGGGLIGIEFAGDLAYYAKEAGKTIKITLVNSKEHLGFREMTPKAAAMVQRKLETLGVEVIFNERVTKDGDRVVLEKAQKQVDAEQVVWCTGFYSCNSFLDSQFLDDRGWVQVDEYFRVKGAENSLFALGDCCDLLPNAGSQILGTMGVIGKNVAVTLDATQAGTSDNIEKKMRKALVQPEVYVSTIGRQTGVAQMPCGHTQFMFPWIKNSSMFLFNPKGTLGLKE